MVNRFAQRIPDGLASARRAGISPRWGLPAILLVIALVPGCARSPGGQSETGAGAQAPAEAAWWGAEERLENLDPADFQNATQITNEWFPLKPGTRFTYEGSAIDDEGKTVHRIMQINVTDLTKMIGGVRSVVAWDLDWADGELVEAELAFYAQDDAGNVWLMGEYPEEYEDGKLVAAPGWVHGLEDARAGILVPGSPALGTPSFSQGWGPAVGFTDRGKVDSTGVRTCVPADCYDDVLVIVETSKEEVDAEQIKYYARGVGNVRVGFRGAKESEQQARHLMKVETLDARAMTEVRSKALELEKSGFANSPNVLAKTPPLERAGK